MYEKMFFFLSFGVSPVEFRKCRMTDIDTMIDVRNAHNEKQERQNQINKMLGGFNG